MYVMKEIEYQEWQQLKKIANNHNRLIRYIDKKITTLNKIQTLNPIKRLEIKCFKIVLEDVLTQLIAPERARPCD